MASKRHQRRVQERRLAERKERQCLGKIVYDSERSAMLSARAIGKRRGIELVGYACPHCSTPSETRFHVGHDVLLRGDRSMDMAR